MKRRLLPALFCLRVKAAFFLLKLLEALALVPREAPELHAVSAVTRKTLKLGITAPADRILLLLPHCLQHHECPHRVTYSIDNCRRCGKCVIGEIVELSGSMGVEARVTTGGTLARRLLREKAPALVVAVACPRDLGQGIIDSLPIPAIGVLNSRPNGDCFDTAVAVDRLREMLLRVLSHGLSTVEGCSPSAGRD